MARLSDREESVSNDREELHRDFGVEHFHRYAPSLKGWFYSAWCSCGFRGTDRKMKSVANLDLLHHLKSSKEESP